MEFRAGDIIRIESNKVGTPPRRGRIEEVLQDEPIRITVEWEDGHLSILEPTGGNLRLEWRDGI